MNKDEKSACYVQFDCLNACVPETFMFLEKTLTLWDVAEIPQVYSFNSFLRIDILST